MGHLLVVQGLSKESTAGMRRLSNLCPNSVHSGDERRLAAANRRARSPGRRQPRAAARMGATLRAAPTGPNGRRVPPLLGRGRAARAADAGTPRGGRLRGRGRPLLALAAEACFRTPFRAARCDSPTCAPRSTGARRGRPRRRRSTVCSLTFTVESVLDEVVLPYLRDLGGRWETWGGDDRAGALRLASRAGPAPRAGTRLGSWQRAARGAGRPAGRAARSRPADLRPRAARARLADHLPRRRTRRSRRSAETVRQLAPDAVVLAVTDADRFDAIAAPLRDLAGETTIWLAGSGADPDAAERAGRRAARPAARRRRCGRRSRRPPRARGRAGRRPSRAGGSARASPSETSTAAGRGTPL